MDCGGVNCMQGKVAQKQSGKLEIMSETLICDESLQRFVFSFSVFTTWAVTSLHIPLE